MNDGVIARGKLIESIVKNKMTDHAKTIRNNTDFVGIAKVAVNVELFFLRARSSMGGRGGLSGFIRGIIIVKVMGFCIGFELFDDTVGVFGIVFCDPGFDPRRIENSHICLCRIDGVTDGFRKGNELIENKPKIIEEILLKAGDLRSIGDLIKTAERTKVSGVVKKYQKQGIRWDRKNPPDDECP